MSDEELDPAILRALRDVAPAPDSVRDAHIAAALSAMAPVRGSSHRRTRVLGGIAAAFMLAVGGVALANRQPERDRGPLTGTTASMPPKGSDDCSDDFSGLWGDVGDSEEVRHNDKQYVVMFRDDNIDVYEATEPCSLIGTMGYGEQLVARDNEGLPPDLSVVCSYATEPVSRFNDRANGDPYGLVLVQTDEGLSLHFEDKCDDPIVTLALP